MQSKIRIQDILYSSSVDGTGFRDVVFVNYCPHRCEGCHNMETWDEKNGRYVSVDEVFSCLVKSSITNVTFSGGEPFCQAEALCELARMIHEKTNKDIWIYSGYTYEEIIKDAKMLELLKECKVLVDGKFVISKKGHNLRFIGSSNQRILDVQKSLKAGFPVSADI